MSQSMMVKLAALTSNSVMTEMSGIKKPEINLATTTLINQTTFYSVSLPLIESKILPLFIVTHSVFELFFIF
jgi:hypothetical protein